MRIWFATLALCLAFAACDSDGGETTARDAGDVSGPAATDVVDGDAPLAADITPVDAAKDESGGGKWPFPDTSTTCEGVVVHEITGRFTTPSGAPPASGLVALCGSMCQRGTMAEDGTFEVGAGSCFMPHPVFERPVLWFHGAPDHTDLHIDFIEADATEVGPLELEPTYTVVPVSEMTTLTVPAEGVATLEDGDGFALSFDAAGVDLPIGVTDLAVQKLEPTYWPPLPGVEDLRVFYATAPAGAEFDPPATLRLPNEEDLAPGTRVAIVGLGNEGTPGVHPGTLGVLAEGEVTPDGTAIELLEGEGLPGLAWVGYTLLP